MSTLAILVVEHGFGPTREAHGVVDRVECSEGSPGRDVVGNIDDYGDKTMVHINAEASTCRAFIELNDGDEVSWDRPGPGLHTQVPVDVRLRLGRITRRPRAVDVRRSAR